MLIPSQVSHLARRAPATRRLALLLAVLLLTLTTLPGLSQAASAVAWPAANASLSTSPSRIAVPVSGAGGRGTVELLNASGQRVASLRAAVRAGVLRATLHQRLRPGVYTIAWHAPGADPAIGTYGFSIENGTGPALVNDASPPAALNPLWMGLPRFFAFAFEMTMIGTLALRFLVTRRAVREYGERALPVDGPIERRLLQTAAISGVLFIPAYLSQLTVESYDSETPAGFWAMIQPSRIWTYLTTQPDGHVWEARILLALLCAILLAPAGVATLRKGWTTGRRDSRIMALALVAGVAELLARVIPTETPPNWAREIFTQLLDFGHLTAASVWVGGLVALTLLAVSVRGVNVEAPSLWGSFLKRFSLVATVCVVVMVLTGLWTYWLHVGAPKLLVHTLYGETLLVKLLLVVGLVALGAVNQLWLLPRVQALRAVGGGDGKVMRQTIKHFRKVLAVEAAIGLAILFVVPQLASSARNQAFQQAGGALTAYANTDAGQVSLRRSGLEPGLTDYDIRLPGGVAGAVEVSFSPPRPGLAPITTPAIQIGDGRYRVTGIDTPIAGTWDATVSQAGGPTAHLQLPVNAVPEEPVHAPQPGITASTWMWGAGWVLAIIIALGGATLASRQQFRRHHRVLAEA